MAGRRRSGVVAGTGGVRLEQERSALKWMRPGASPPPCWGGPRRGSPRPSKRSGAKGQSRRFARPPTPARPHKGAGGANRPDTQPKMQTASSLWRGRSMKPKRASFVFIFRSNRGGILPPNHKCWRHGHARLAESPPTQRAARATAQNGRSQRSPRAARSLWANGIRLRNRRRHPYFCQPLGRRAARRGLLPRGGRPRLQARLIGSRPGRAAISVSGRQA
jgi:hypothetical protein